MKNKFHLLVGLLLLCIFKNAFAGEFQIIGHFQHISDQWIYLDYLNDSLKKQRDSAYAVDGKFIFRGTIAEPTRASVATADDKIGADFFFEPGRTKMAGDTLFPDDVMISGGQATKEYTDYLIGETPRMHQRDSMSGLSFEARKNGDTLAAKQRWNDFQLVYTAHKREEENWMVEHNNSVVNAFLLYAMYVHPGTVAKGDSLLKLMTADVHRSKYIRKRAMIKQHMEKTAINQPVVHFAQNDPTGKGISTQAFSGKYFLIDFWASWCGPCRRENPALVKAYQRFHPKGFEIIGCSLDDTKEKWVAAIAKDSLTWSHVSDLKGWQNQAAELYAVRGIPENYLIDKNGTIIAKSLHGEALNATLEEIFGK